MISGLGFLDCQRWASKGHLMNHFARKLKRIHIPIVPFVYLAMLISGYAAAQVPPTPTEHELTIDQLISRYTLREDSVASRDIEGWQNPTRILVQVDSSERLHWMQQAVPDVELVEFDTVEIAVREIGSFQAVVGLCHPDLLTSNIHWVHVFSAGIEHCTAIPAARKNLRILSNGQRLKGPEIADHAIALMLSLVRRLDIFSRQQSWTRGQDYNALNLRGLEGQTLLVVGLGGIGTSIAKLGHGLGMRVIATRNSRREGPDFVSYVGLADELLELARQADVIINATPLTASTSGIFNWEFFTAVPDHAYFINIGRGRSVVTADLVKALEEGEITGAGLDVTDPEPLPDGHPLWSAPRVIITPHMAGRSEEVTEKTYLVARENIRRYSAGEALLSVVDIKRGY
jgi:phosphoglycerate dehydrogenase-like enzyme